MIESFIEKLNSESTEVIIIGDLNCNMFDSSNFAMKKLTDLLCITQLTQVIVKPTRVTQTTSTLLDVYIIASLPEKIIYSDVFPRVSYHNLIFVVRKINTCTKNKWEFIRLLNLGISNILTLVHSKKISYLTHGIS